ncbi:hypothetical protein ACHWQZ_G007725 [Mnemiopsis leidyi]
MLEKRASNGQPIHHTTQVIRMENHGCFMFNKGFASKYRKVTLVCQVGLLTPESLTISTILLMLLLVLG